LVAANIVLSSLAQGDLYLCSLGYMLRGLEGVNTGKSAGTFFYNQMSNVIPAFMLKKYSDTDIQKASLDTKTVAILGYGSQGRAQALNLRDSGVKVIVGNRRGKSFEKAEADGFSVMPVKEAVLRADVLALMLPDESAAEIYKSDIAPFLKSGQTLLFAHGFNIHYGFIKVPQNINVIMVAPKAPGHTVRSEYTVNRGVPSLIAIEQNPSGNSKEIALSYASAIGSGRAGIIETTFKEETETDLFGEQNVICGGVDQLIKAGFETLVEAGYSPYMAYFEVCHELKLIVDLINEGGIENMHYSISNNAEYGDYTRGVNAINSFVKEGMKQNLKQIQNGSYAKEFIEEFHSGSKHFNELRKKSCEHLIEKVGAEIRSSFSWGNKTTLVDKNKN